MRLATLSFLVATLFSVLVCAQSLRFVAYGDSRTQPDIHYGITGFINWENPDLVLHVGDIWDDYSASEWKGHLTSRPNLNNLLNSNNYLVARGNHESEGEVLRFTPPIVRDNRITYSFVAGNVFFVSLGMNPSATYLEGELQRPEASAATFRVIYHHYPVYSGGSRPVDGNYNLERVCDRYNVTLSIAGHHHHYERTRAIYDGRGTSSGASIAADTKGTVYIVTGGGGAPLSSITSGGGWWTEYIESTYHYCTLAAYDDRIEFLAKNNRGATIDRMVRWVAPNGNGVAMQSPKPGSMLRSSTIDFEWDAGDAWDFDLLVGTQGPGSTDIRSSDVFGDTSLTVECVPMDGRTLNVRLWRWNGAWLHQDYTYQTRSCE